MPTFRVWAYESREAGPFEVQADDAESAKEVAFELTYSNPKLWRTKDGSHEVEEIAEIQPARKDGE